jgi:hypothetical protein
LEKLIVSETFDHIELVFEDDDAIKGVTIGVLCLP